VEGRPLRPLEESELIGLAKDGDVGAYEELVRRYQGLAVRTAHVVLRGASEAEDAAQEAFVKAYHALSRFREGAPFRPWLLRIVTNEAINRRKASGRQVRLALRLAESTGESDRPSGDAAPSPEAAVLAADERATLLAAVNRLREEDRMVLGYRFFLGLSEAETAGALGCALGTVKSRQSRALRRLRSQLGATPALSRVSEEDVGG
jgi:RNA polymerase sigma-70 factor (ECF subfamily)